MFMSLLLLIFISIFAFWVTCWWILLADWIGIIWIWFIIIGIIMLFFFIKWLLWVYIWRYFGVSIIISIIISLVLSIIQIPIYSIFWWGIYDINNSNITTTILLYSIFPLISFLIYLFAQVYIFHFYRMKSKVEAIQSWTVFGDISHMLHKNFGPIIRFFWIDWRSETWEKNTINTEIVPKSSETIDLMNSIAQADISNIDSITFLPKDGIEFTIKTTNIKQLVVYITTKLEKTIFEAEELEKPFDYVVKNIASDLSTWDFELISGKIEEFVKSGGEVKINKI